MSHGASQKDSTGKERNVLELCELVLRRDITLQTTVHLVKAMVFPVVLRGCESWNIKEAEC